MPAPIYLRRYSNGRIPDSGRTMQQISKGDIPLREITDPTPLPGDGKFYVRLVEGFYQNLRRLISWPLIVGFFALAWIRIEGQPLILFDFASHRIFLFGSQLSWYELPILAGLMIAGAGLLFFMAVGWGRIWCGFACPQSIWTWIFIRLEQLTEGRAAQRAKYDREGLGGIRLIRRVSKHLLWASVSLLTAVSFSGYFVPVEQLLQALFTLNASPFTYGWIIIMALLTYLNAGLIREKVCLHMCPYSRFQGVMFDRDTLTVTYDQARGEPRSHLRGSPENSGDCIDCHICVQVCPTGIDIRNGLQSACIDCGACIDACDQVMSKLGRARGLIEFYSETQLATAMTEPQPGPVSLLRPRLIGYLAISVVTLFGVAYSLNHRSPVLIEIAKERGQLYQVTDEEVCNTYLLELERFSDTLKQLYVSVQSQDSTNRFRLVGKPLIELSGDQTNTIYQVCTPKQELSQRQKIRFIFTSENLQIDKISRFLAP